MKIPKIVKVLGLAGLLGGVAVSQSSCFLDEPYQPMDAETAASLRWFDTAGREGREAATTEYLNWKAGENLNIHH